MPVAQLDRALACGAKGRKFESYRAYQIHRGVAQLVARVVRDDEAVRSSRITPTRDYSRFDGRDFLFCAEFGRFLRVYFTEARETLVKIPQILVKISET